MMYETTTEWPVMFTGHVLLDGHTSQEVLPQNMGKGSMILNKILSGNKLLQGDYFSVANQPVF